MPGTNDPNAPVFYVYEFSTNGKVFYVGSGWVTRASDRFNHVRRLIQREQRGEQVPKKLWLPVCRVIRILKFERGEDIAINYPVGRRTQPVARELEDQIRAKRLEEGCVLANVVGNPKWQSVDAVIQWVLS
jgi:hypothetical protein